MLDNGHYGETGMQTSHTGLGIDLAAVATAMGFAESRVVTTNDELAQLIRDHAEVATGPRLAVLKIRAENLPRSMPSPGCRVHQEPLPRSPRVDPQLMRRAEQP